MTRTRMIPLDPAEISTHAARAAAGSRSSSSHPPRLIQRPSMSLTPYPHSQHHGPRRQHHAEGCRRAGHASLKRQTPG